MPYWREGADFYVSFLGKHRLCALPVTHQPHVTALKLLQARKSIA